MNELLKIEIPDYMTHVTLCESRANKHYTRKRRLPLKYCNINYCYNAYGVLIDKSTGEPVLANPKTAGTPMLKKINSHELYSGRTNRKTLTKIFRQMAAFYSDRIPRTKRISRACRIRLEIHNTEMARNDLYNISWLTLNAIKDALTMKKILPELQPSVLNGFEIGFVPIDNPENRKVVVSLLPDEKNEVTGQETA